MTSENLTKPLITLFLSSSVTLPVVQMLIEKELLAGVVVTPRMDADSANLEQQLKQAQIPVIRYDSQNIPQTVINIKKFSGNIGLVVTFSVILPKEAISCFEHGIFNVHASLLPLYKGNNPIFWQLKNVDKKTAVAIHKVENTVDTGDIAVSYKFDIHPLDTFGTLSGAIFQIIPVVINEFIELFIQHNGKIPLEKQQGDTSAAPTPTKRDVCIDWNNMSAEQIAALARACNPNLGGAQFSWKGGVVGIMEAKALNTPAYGVDPGVILHIGAPEGLIVATKQGTLRIEIVYMLDGLFSGLCFADRFSLDAGESFKNTV